MNWENQIAATKSLIADLSTRAGIEGRNSSAEKSSVPPKQKPRKARRRRRKPVAARKRTPTAPVPVAVPASGYQRKAANAPLKAVRGAAAFATELQAIDEIVAALSKADHALTKATRARDAAGITAASEKIQQLRRQGNELLVRLGGKARLPIDKAERMRWKRAAATAWAPKPKKKKRYIPPPPAPPKKIDSGWRADENGTMSREIITS